MEMVLTGDRMSAQEAQTAGMLASVDCLTYLAEILSPLQLYVISYYISLYTMSQKNSHAIFV